VSTNGNTFYLQVRPEIPKALSRLEELAEDLWFAWNARARSLFYLMDEVLWQLCDHNPRLFLRRISQSRLDEMAIDRSFLALYNGVLSYYDSYKEQGHQWYPYKFDDADQHAIAYFSAEFGLHESLPIYSGGLGILAGDHCKSASDLGLPFTAVGLLYRQGYFTQAIDAHGRQIASYHDCRFEDLCIDPVEDASGQHLMVQVELPGRQLNLKVWRAKAGHMRMVLLDADDASNSEEDRRITNQLYGGGLENRIRQEVCLGIGGVRALRAMGIAPTVWHANEGHASFIILERMREFVEQHGLSFAEALEATRAGTVFTTHTPVPAGHDIFPSGMFDEYMGHFAEKLGIKNDQLHALGHGDFGHGSSGFNQTALAIHGSSYVNGVAKLHGEVSSEMCHSMWPQVPAEENPMSSVTNGVHVTTWLAQEWISAFDQQLGGQWRGHLMAPEFWEGVHDIPDHLFWSIHQANKERMLQYVRELLERQARRNGENIQLTREMTAQFDVRTLVIGFARRFATYKRASLLFQDEEKLLKLLNDIDHPVVFLFAGKAHPADQPGQDLIRRVHEIARRPEFIGKVLMLEGYDMTLSRYMLSGVDVWLNNPIRPMEASGTSGMKAAMNGVPNLSILDGWWPEGFEGDNGWSIGGERDMGDESLRDIDDFASLMHTLRYDVIPTYYQRNDSGYSDAWVHVSKRAMISSIPRFNTDRMVAEYTTRFYIPASYRVKALHADNFSRTKQLAVWKAKLNKAWPKLKLEVMDGMPEGQLSFKKELCLRVKAHLNGLSPEDVHVEVVFSRPKREGGYKQHLAVELQHAKNGVFEADIHTGDTGNFAYQVRMYPKHADLPHPQAMGLMIWL